MFQKQRGIGGDRNLAGVVRAREERKIQDLVLMDEGREGGRVFSVFCDGDG